MPLGGSCTSARMSLSNCKQVQKANLIRFLRDGVMVFDLYSVDSMRTWHSLLRWRCKNDFGKSGPVGPYTNRLGGSLECERRRHRAAHQEYQPQLHNTPVRVSH